MGGQNSGGSGAILPGGEYLNRRPAPKVAGGDEKGQEELPPNAKQKRQAKSLEVELGLSGMFSMEICPNQV